MLELLAVAVALAAVGFVAYTLQAVDAANHRMDANNQRLQRHVAAQDTVITRLSTGLDTTRRQLQQHHVTPKAPAASSIVQGIQGVPGVPGPAGASGVAGSPGPSGAPGTPGSNGANGRNGSPGVAGSPGPAGPSGAPGSPGPASTVAGPAGPAGPRGDTGPQGPKGDTGGQGPAGPPPSGWTFTYTDTLGHSQSYNCTPDSPGSTHYSCQPTGSSGPLKSNSPARSALSLAGLLAMAAYRRFGPRLD